ncbi:hypothetical protein F8388_012867 [Cannabis sativa]|uniref:Desiccation-related protein PCC13-62 n=1 Tax=Cannabis sativa TaxID=3483 RepID=A0A7J6ESJ0_CANSA|nr:hypothetical protein F8388_012867 [Cannabis sativa]
MATPIILGVILNLILLLPKSLAHIYSDNDLLEFSLNLEYVGAEFFLHGSLGYGLDRVAPQLTKGGPPPIGATKVNFDILITDFTMQMGLQGVDHIRAIKNFVEGFQRPLLDLSSSVFAGFINSALGRELKPAFDPYNNTLNFLIASYAIAHIGPTAYLAAGLLGVSASQDAVIRTLLYDRREMRVEPYNITVAEFTQGISELWNRLGRGGLKDEGLIVPIALGAEGRVSGNVLSADQNSLLYGRTPLEVVRIVYGTGNETMFGGFFPRGANGRIAKSCLLVS